MSYSSMAVKFFTMPRSRGDPLPDPNSHGLSNPTRSTDPRAPADSGDPEKHALKDQIPVSRTPPPRGTFGYQDNLPKLPIPDLESTCRKYLESLLPLQSAREHEDTKAAVQD